jgi:DegV family protein with EDD domain
MSDYVITCSSTYDLNNDFAEKNGITVLPYQYFIDGKEHYDDKTTGSMSIHEFYEKMRAGGVATTSMVNTERYTAFFTPFLEDGKDVVHIEFSSGLSGSYNNALMTARQLMEKYPGRRVEIVDGLSASPGYGLLVYYAIQKRDEGADVDELVKYVDELKYKIIHWFAVDSLEYLRRGGRVSRASAFLGTMLNIKPVLAFNNEGKIIPVEKIRGRKKSLIDMIDKMEKDIDGPDGQMVFIGHADAEEDAKMVESAIKERFPTIKGTHIDYIGPVIGAHAGPSTIAIFYIGKARVDKEFK